MSELLWVGVPSGRRATEASVRVLVVPKLAEGSLGDFGLQDWPATLNDEVGFEIRLRTATGERSTQHIPSLVSRARSELWSEFFGGDAGLVRAWRNRTRAAPVVSDTFRTGTKVATTVRRLTRTGADKSREETTAALDAEIAGWADSAVSTPAGEVEPPLPVVADFHRTVSNLREHPAVLLELGLVFELRIPVADLEPGTWSLSVRCSDPPFLRQFVTSPWTRYELTDTVFRPAPADAASGIRAGVLDLSDSVSLTDPTAAPAQKRWAISTFDIDGAADGLRQAAHDYALNPPDHPVMPPIRSSGIALIRPARRRDFEQRRGAAGRRDASAMGDAVLTAEDLVLGYRVDVRREGAAWQSVCERDASYRVNGVDIVAGREEGHVKPFAAVRGADGTLRADEVVLRWVGWNLAVPMPNLRGDTGGPADNPAHPLPFDFRWDFAIPRGRMPALRFADLYQLRVRIADMAGGGLTPEELRDNTIASANVSYLRHEPVQPPTLHGPAGYAAGAGIERLVIRSDHDMTVAQIHTADPDYPATESRTIRPPTVPFPLIEQHRMFDDLSDPESFALAQRAMRSDGAGAGLPDPVANGIQAFVAKTELGLATSISDLSAWAPSWPDPAPKTIRLEENSGARPITVHWAGDTLEVTLAKAKQATIELTSTLDGELSNHLAISDFLAGSGAGDPTISPDGTKLGRNPIVTPPRRVLVVHAVKRPLREPRWDLPAAAVIRNQHDTTVLLEPTFPAAGPDAGLDTDSTGRLDVAAAWTEFADVGPQAGSGERQVTLAHLHSQTIARGELPPVRIRHEFGDTKHRTVTYTLHATSRFRQYFKPTEPESAFELTRAQAPVDVLSSARPSAPTVLGVVPAFRWTQERIGPDRIELTRACERVRVELARPWYETGEGEQLAVLVAPTSDPPPSISGVVTRMGRDPLFGTPATEPFPPSSWFAGAADPAEVDLAEVGRPVTVVPFSVTPSGDRWFADVEFAVPPERQSYNPFVRLAVARYQRDSLDGLELSPAVIAESVPLLPDRRVVVERRGSQLHVTVSGTSPTPLNRVEVVLETCPASVEPERLDLLVDDPDVDSALPVWRPVPGHTVERGQDGTIPPLPLPASAGHLRLRLRETEHFAGRDDPQISRELADRTVFVGAIVLPAEW
ncbi:hypothetical protein ACFQZZ_01420 [Nocardia sp. GCM10030253]|uniref:hypothetical protein n=1 Tax=Nocardia sp. GCM10030253 TaxID=3273404 RepID=UPI00363832FA